MTAVGEVVGYVADPRAGLDQVDALAQRTAAALAPGGILVLDVPTTGRAGPTGHQLKRVDLEGATTVTAARESADGTRLDRRIMVIRHGPDGSRRRTDEHHVLRLLDPHQVATRLAATGLAVRRLDHYGAGDETISLPQGWAAFVARRTPPKPR